MLDTTQVNEALLYARNYDGVFPFMTAMRQRILDGQAFSFKQIQAILNSKAASMATSAVVRPYAVVDLRSNVPPGRTRHAIAHITGLPMTFYQINNVDKGKYAGNVFVREVQGAKLSKENLGRQRPGEMYRGRAYADMTAIILDPDATMGDYGRQIGQCALCFKTLTDEVSRKVGIGPKCLNRSIKRGD